MTLAVEMLYFSWKPVPSYRQLKPESDYVSFMGIPSLDQSEAELLIGHVSFVVQSIGSVISGL